MQFNKCETCNSLRNKIEDLHEVLSKLTMRRYILYMILSHQRVFYSKAFLGYQSNNNAKSFMSIFHSKMKMIHIVYKCNIVIWSY